MDSFSRTIRFYVLMIIGILGLSAFVFGSHPYVYDIVYLDTFGRTSGQAYRINELKQVIGWVGGGELPAVMVFWDLDELASNGVTHIITDAFNVEKHCWVYDLNDNSMVVGSYQPEEGWGAHRPFIYNARSRTWEDLGCLADGTKSNQGISEEDSHYGGTAFAINNANQVVGVSYGKIPELGNYVTLWGGPNSHTALGFVDDYLKSAPGWFWGLNDLGESAGNLGEHPFYGTTSINILPLPAGYTEIGQAFDINNSGQAVGLAQPGTLENGDRPVLWNRGYPPVVLETYDQHGIAFGINNSGDIVGGVEGDGVLWSWTGITHQLIDLNQYIRSEAVSTIHAFDINDQGWIVGHARWGVGNERPFVLIPRTDEAAPTARFDDRQPDAGSAHYEFTVIYEDNGIINEHSLDDNDLTVRGPNGYNERAAFVKVGLPGQASEDTWYWEATYRIPPPGDLWNDDDKGEYTIHINHDQVSDHAEYYVEEGDIGSFVFNAHSVDVWMERGVEYGPDDKIIRNRFYMTINLAILNELLWPVQNVWIATPGGAEYLLSDDGTGRWSFSEDADARKNFMDFADGTYTIYLDFGSEFIAEQDIWFGIPESNDPIPPPAEVPVFIKPRNSAADVATNPDFKWTAPSDPMVNSAALKVSDTADGRIVVDELFEDPGVTGWPYVALFQSHVYSANLSLRNGYYHQPIEAWNISTSKYTARNILFATEHPEQNSYEKGDLDGNGAYKSSSLVILRLYLAGNISHGEEPFTQPLLAADMNGDQAVDSRDLVHLANRIAEN